MQLMYAVVENGLRELTLPPATHAVMPGIAWGAFDELLTPAYWRGQVWQYQELGRFQDLTLGRNLMEEVAACLLGGFGMPAELGLAAYARVRESGALSTRSTAILLEELLSEPFLIEGRLRQYRFPRQKAAYLASCLAKLDEFEEPVSDVDLRGELASLPGVGLKTASWVTRNYRKSDAVAVIDIHIMRAGTLIGLFPDDWKPQTHYLKLEEKFLEFAAAIDTPAGMLDAVMWDHMRRVPSSRSMIVSQLALSFA